METMIILGIMVLFSSLGFALYNYDGFDDTLIDAFGV